jgi:DNA-binding GntR family transcriptional regulator
MKKYDIVRQYLLEKIKQLYPNDRIPSERELLQTLQFSRETIRKAIDQLVAEGVIYRVNNSGAFVANSGVKHYHKTITDIRDEARNELLRRDIHRVRLISAQEDVAKALMIAVDTPVIQMQSTTYEVDFPVAYEESYFNAEILKDADLSLLRLLGQKYLTDQLDLDYANKINQYKAVLPLTIVQHHLRLQPHQPIIYIQSTTYLKDGRPVEYYKGYINDHHSHVVLVTRL